eukprot:105465-Heterocapsa_arctica.AAC.1
MATDGVSVAVVDQCMIGAATTKPTELLLSKVDASLLPPGCCHPVRWWRVPWSGAWHRGAHPPLRGRQMAIPP